MARKKGLRVEEVVVAAPLERRGAGKKRRRRRGGRKKGRGGKKRRKIRAALARKGGGREREEEGSLVHGEIARPLTILRYYARPFLQRQPLLARSRAQQTGGHLGIW